MPLFTYIVSYKDETTISQISASNFTGWVSEWTSSLKTLSPSEKTEFSKKAIRVQFQPVANRRNVWSKTIPIGDSLITVIAVQTER